MCGLLTWHRGIAVQVPSRCDAALVNMFEQVKPASQPFVCASAVSLHARRGCHLACPQVISHVPALAGMPGLRQEAMTVRKHNTHCLIPTLSQLDVRVVHHAVLKWRRHEIRVRLLCRPEWQRPALSWSSCTSACPGP